MSLAFVGTGRAQNTSGALPTAASTFSACGWAKLDASHASFGAVFEIFKGSAPQNQLVVGAHGASGTTLSMYVNLGTTSNVSFIDVGTGWFFWALVASGGTVTVKVSLEADSGWTAQPAGVALVSFVPSHSTVGGNVYGENLTGKTTLTKSWNVAQTFDNLLLQKRLVTPFSGTSILASYEMPSTASDLAGNLVSAAGAGANMTAEGTGVAYSTAYPVFTTIASSIRRSMLLGVG